MVKLALGVIVFNGMPFIEGMLETFYPYVDQICVAEGPVAFWHQQGHERSNDGTVELLIDLQDRWGSSQMRFTRNVWKDKLQMVNAWLGLVRDDITHVLCFDADEFMLKEDIELIISLLEEKQYESVGLRLYSFVGGFDRYMTGFEEQLEVIRVQPYHPGATWATHRPPTITWPGREMGKHLNWNTLDNLGVRLYHYSHVLPSQVLAKQAYYANYVGEKNVIPGYYKNVWLPWVMTGDVGKANIEKSWNGIHDFHPRYRGDCFSRKFEGPHPWWIQMNKERIMEIQRKEIGQ